MGLVLVLQQVYVSVFQFQSLTVPSLLLVTWSWSLRCSKIIPCLSFSIFWLCYHCFLSHVQSTKDVQQCKSGMKFLLKVALSSCFCMMLSQWHNFHMWYTCGMFGGGFKEHDSSFTGTQFWLCFYWPAKTCLYLPLCYIFPFLDALMMQMCDLATSEGRSERSCIYFTSRWLGFSVELW
jgi:hypothetical protein